MTDLQKAYNAFLEGRIRKEQNGSIEKEREVTKVSQLEINVLKRMLAQNRNKDGLLLHITETYRRLSEQDELIKAMEIDQKEMSDAINSLKSTIQREQKKRRMQREVYLVIRE